MFIKNLGQKQKELFLHLACKAAEANGEVVEDEKEMMEEFGKEASLPPVFYTEKSLEEILNELKNISTESELKIIALETLSVLKSDSEVDEEERAFFAKLINTFGIDEETTSKIESLLSRYTDIYEELYMFVFGISFK